MPESVIRFQGIPLPQAQGDMADGLRRVAQAWQSGQSFRAIAQAPWIELQPCRDDIECTTCGSSGDPKVIRRKRNSWQQTFVLNQRLFGLSHQDRSAIFGGLNHSLALYGLCESLYLGMTVNMLNGMRPRSQVSLLQAEQISVLYITPTQLRLLTGSAEQLPSVRLILCGGGKLDLKTRERAMRVCPQATIHEFYGASETSFITLADASTPEGSVGRAYPGVDIEIRHPQQGIGEVWVRSPYLFSGYALGGSDETRSDGDFMTVGELGWLDEQGYLWLTGRRSRMVTIADKNVFPEAVEMLISQQPTVVQCAVLAVRDPQRGHRLHAFIQGQADPQWEKQLRQVISHQLGPEMVPKSFSYLTELPLLAAGKVDLRALEKLLP